MPAPSVPPHVTALLQKMTALTPGPTSVWLIGSRANGRASQESDTDLLVFGSPAFSEAARANLPREVAVDVLVVTDGDKFEDVWMPKTGSLTQWGWKQGAGATTYKGTKWLPDPPEDAMPGANTGTPIERIEQAICLWSEDSPGECNG
jgi:hypothetical protein